MLWGLGLKNRLVVLGSGIALICWNLNALGFRDFRVCGLGSGNIWDRMGAVERVWTRLAAFV